MALNNALLWEISLRLHCPTMAFEDQIDHRRLGQAGSEPISYLILTLPRVLDGRSFGQSSG
jgi:hypothetical protein